MLLIIIGKLLAGNNMLTLAQAINRFFCIRSILKHFQELFYQ